MPLTSLANVKTQLDIPVLDTTQDTLLTRLILVASEAIEKYCGRHLAQVTLTEYYDGTRTPELIVDNWPVVVTGLYLDNEHAFGSETLVAASNYIVRDYIIKLYDGIWPRGVGNIKLVYQGGYASIPSDLEHGAIMFVELLFRKKNDRNLGRTSISKNGESVSYTFGIPDEIKFLIDPYRSVRFRNATQALGR